MKTTITPYSKNTQPFYAKIGALGLITTSLLLGACAGPQRIQAPLPANPPVSQVPAIGNIGAGQTQTSPNPPAALPRANQAPAPTPVTAPNNTSPAPASKLAVVNGSFTGDCANYRFQKVTANPKNSAYAAPILTFSCNGNTLTIKSNGIPNFEYVQTNPNRLQAQNYTWNIAQKPARANAITAVPMGGPSAIAVNGIPIFGPTEAPNDGYQDPYLQGILDFCSGHPAQRGDYHFHARPNCILSDNELKKPGTVIGYAFDGFPILSPYVCADAACSSTKKLNSSWRVTSATAKNAWEKHSYVAGAGDLDRCNGLNQPDGSYAYYATDSFPYFMGCYVGTPANIRP